MALPVLCSSTDPVNARLTGEGLCEKLKNKPVPFLGFFKFTTVSVCEAEDLNKLFLSKVQELKCRGLELKDIEQGVNCGRVYSKTKTDNFLFLVRRPAGSESVISEFKNNYLFPRLYDQGYRAISICKAEAHFRDVSPVVEEMVYEAEALNERQKSVDDSWRIFMSDMLEDFKQELSDFAKEIDPKYKGSDRVNQDNGKQKSDLSRKGAAGNVSLKSGDEAMPLKVEALERPEFSKAFPSISQASEDEPALKPTEPGDDVGGGTVKGRIADWITQIVDYKSLSHIQRNVEKINKESPVDSKKCLDRFFMKKQGETKKEKKVNKKLFDNDRSITKIYFEFLQKFKLFQNRKREALETMDSLMFSLFIRELEGAKNEGKTAYVYDSENVKGRFLSGYIRKAMLHGIQSENIVIADIKSLRGTEAIDKLPDQGEELGGRILVTAENGALVVSEGSPELPISGRKIQELQQGAMGGWKVFGTELSLPALPALPALPDSVEKHGDDDKVAPRTEKTNDCFENIKAAITGLQVKDCCSVGGVRKRRGKTRKK